MYLLLTRLETKFFSVSFGRLKSWIDLLRSVKVTTGELHVSKCLMQQTKIVQHERIVGA